MRARRRMAAMDVPWSIGWRQHSVEFVLFSAMIGPGGPAPTLFQASLMIALHLLTFHRLRHSSVWIAARGGLGRLVHSPGATTSTIRPTRGTSE